MLPVVVFAFVTDGDGEDDDDETFVEIKFELDD